MSQNKVTCLSRLIICARCMTLDWDCIQCYSWMIKRLKSVFVKSKIIWIVLFMKTNTERQMLSINTLGRITRGEEKPFQNKGQCWHPNKWEKAQHEQVRLESTRQLWITKHPQVRGRQRNIAHFETKITKLLSVRLSVTTGDLASAPLC